MKKQKNPFIIFFILVTLQGLAANFAHPITPTIIYNLGLESYSFGLFYAAMAFSNFLFSPMWAKQVKSIGSRKVLGISCIGYAIGQAMFGMFTTIPTIMLARVVSGFFVGGIMVSYLTYIVAIAPIDKKPTYLAASATISTVAAAFGYLIGGIVGAYSIPITFVLQVSLLIICGVLFATKLENDAQEDFVFNLIKDGNPFKIFVDSRHFMTRTFFLVFLAVFISSVATTCFDQSFNYYIKDVFQYNSAYNGILKAVVGFISLVANTTICIWILRKTNFRRSIIYIFAGCSFTLLSLTFISSVIVFIIVVLLFFAFNSIYLPVLQNVCITESKKEDANNVIGFYNSIKSLGMIIGALYAGFVYDISNTLPFISAGTLFLIVVYILRKYYMIYQTKKQELSQ